MRMGGRGRRTREGRQRRRGRRGRRELGGGRGKLDEAVILTWKRNETFVWKHCTESQCSFNGAEGAMHAMKANFPGGAAAWNALQAQMKTYAAEKNAAEKTPQFPGGACCLVPNPGRL